ncbi:MAG: MMPL family transporter [Candidatus Dormibacteraeota bacterium]|nr:MMPL family transporter [Candidatus Dormibacteraeota bacterium]
MLRSLARWCFRHRRIVAGGWLGLLAAAYIGSQLTGNAYTNSITLPDTQSASAIRLLQSASPQVAGDSEQVVFATTAGALVTDPVIEMRVNSLLQKLGALPHVSQIISPYTTAGSRSVNAAQTVAFATVTFDRQISDLTDSLATTFVGTARAAAGNGLQVAVSGQLAENANPPSLGGAGLGILLAGAVLLLTFGSLIAAALPLVSALVALGAATSLIAVVSHVVSITTYAPEVAVLIGLGVGVDYALFILTRHRQGLTSGLPSEASIVEAVNASGRAVLVAGIIVSIALLGMVVLGVTFLSGLAVATFLGVVFTMIAALTLLPALLGFAGLRALSRRQRRKLASGGQVAKTQQRWALWSAWAAFVSRRPAVPAFVALALVALIATPFLSLRPGTSDEGNDPRGSTTRQAYDLLASGFGAGFNGPLQLVALVHGNTDQATLTRLASTVQKQRDVAGVSAPLFINDSRGSAVGLVNVYPDSAPQDAATATLLTELRDHVVPASLAGSGLTVYVGGETALSTDFDQLITDKLPLFVGIVVLVSFLLLLFVFRSAVIPLISAAMNVLSVAVAFGVLVAVFQWGWLGNLIGVSPGPVEAPLLVFQFAVLFGLSTDYQVFLLSRIREERLKTGNSVAAVRDGLAATGRTITTAALIMILVFASFILGNNRLLKEFGVGFAAGILVDAVLIRMAIVPSLMLLGRDLTWWLPGAVTRFVPQIGGSEPGRVPLLRAAAKLGRADRQRSVRSGVRTRAARD